MINLHRTEKQKITKLISQEYLNEWCLYGLSREQRVWKRTLKRMQIWNSRENAFTIQYKEDNGYLSFHERLCRFNQNETNRIIESAFWRAYNKDRKSSPSVQIKNICAKHKIRRQYIEKDLRSSYQDGLWNYLHETLSIWNLMLCCNFYH